MGDPRAVIVISSDEEDEQQLMAQGNEEVEKHVESSVEPPDWLPDGWIMEAYCNADDGTINKYYTSPVSEYTFKTKEEVMEYLFNGTDERILKAKESAEENQFLRTHDWLPKGWLLEIRAGGRNMDKMYKFFFDPQTGVRLQSKDDVLLYKKEMKISSCVDGECDTSSKDNLLAHVELNPDELPKGWVKEIVFRRTKKGVKKYLYYTDPVTHYSFRTLKSAERYIKTGEIIKRPGCIVDRKMSVYDIYSFDKSADLHEGLRSRLTVGTADQETGLPPIDEHAGTSTILNEPDETK